MSKTPRAILVLFCLLLIAPTLGQWFDLDPFLRHNENRKLAERPELTWTWSAFQKFPREYQAYVNDNFGFRNTLVRGNYLLRYRLLKVLSSKQVVVGQEGWLYYTGEGDLDDCRGITQFNDDQLRRWTRALLLKRNWLAQQGIHYLLVIPPNKSTIYPEYLPAGYKRLRQKTALDDFMDFVRQNSDLNVIDLKAPFLERKQERNLYLRTDTHWNDYGAFLAYQEIIRPLASWFPAITPLTFDDFNITLNKRTGGDLSSMIGGQEIFDDENYVFSPKRPFTAVISEKNNTFTTHYYDKRCGKFATSDYLSRLFLP
jgi:hypothetical protein